MVNFLAAATVAELADAQDLGTRNKKLPTPRKPRLYGALSFAKLSVDPSLDPPALLGKGYGCAPTVSNGIGIGLRSRSDP